MDAATIKEQLLAEIKRDRKAIEAQIAKIEAELKRVPANEKRSLSLEARYRTLALDYFLKKNQAAVREIDKYVCVQLDNVCAMYVIDHAISAEPFHWLRSDPRERLTYTYRFRNRRTFNYDPDCLREIDYRFLSLPAPAYDELIGCIREWYNERHMSDTFNLVTEEYVELCIAPALEEASHSNSFIAKRSQLVDHILSCFRSRDYISLAHILPSFIEGVFHDICVTIGMKSAKLEKASLNVTLKKIQEQTDAFGLEYLLLVFPVRRNRIAHGRDLDESYRDIALSFMLDLDQLMSVAKHRDIPLNELRDILLNPNVRTVKDIFRFPIQELHERIVDECRGLSEWLDSDAFWTELEQQVTAQDIEGKKTEGFVKKLLMRSGYFSTPPATDRITERCKTFLRTVLPTTLGRVTAQAAEQRRNLERIKQLLADNEP